MSREIKFRAWDKKRKCYAKVIQTTNQGWKGYRDKTYITNGIMRFSKWVLSRFIIEEYTGLTDKNGKEIYEGDIVRYHSDILLGHAICVATFYNCRWTLFQHDAPAWAISEWDSENIEVIGNVHENPELLGGEE